MSPSLTSVDEIGISSIGGVEDEIAETIADKMSL